MLFGRGQMKFNSFGRNYDHPVRRGCHKRRVFRCQVARLLISDTRLSLTAAVANFIPYRFADTLSGIFVAFFP